MPQLDTVTLFSQVFWLLFLYFFFFLLFLKYYLPYFSKIFKIRLFLFEDNLNQIKSSQFINILTFLDFLTNFISNLKHYLLLTLKYYNKGLITYNCIFFQKSNFLFVILYLFNNFRLNFYKKLYI